MMVKAACMYSHKYSVQGVLKVQDRGTVTLVQHYAFPAKTGAKRPAYTNTLD